jgi:phosphate transport system substrate-binding protein
MTRGIFRSLFVAAVALTLGTAPSALAEVKLNGAGATFPNPLYQRWVAEYNKMHPDVKIDYQSIGSGGGIKAITEKTVQFAGSDAPLSKKEIEAAGGAANLVEFPSCAGGVVPAYNLQGNPDLKFTGELLADIFMGKVTNWNDQKIASLNPGARLPNQPITPVWRTDGSGTTFVWTNYLATQSEEYKSSIGVGKQVKWPLGQGGKGNEGVAAVVRDTAGALGYIEVNYADQNKIPYGAVKNQAAQFIKASAETISAAGEGVVEKLNGNLLAADLWNQPGDKAYPVAAFTYFIIYKDLNNVQSQGQAQALVDFLWWASHDGQRFAAEMGYAPLAPAVQKKVEAALNAVNYKGNPIKASVAQR